MAFCMYATVTDFFGHYMKEYRDKLGKFEVIIVSRDITASLIDNRNMYNPHYKSKYKNVDFCYNLFPNPEAAQVATGGANETFTQYYRNQLQESKAMYDLCCITDLIVNDNMNVILLCSKLEYVTFQLFDILQEFMDEQFKLQIHSFDEFVDNHAEHLPIGNIDEIKKMLAFQIDANNLKDNLVDGLFNSLYDDMRETYREVLMNKSMDELFRIGTKHSLYISKRKSKEFIVEKILDSMSGATDDSK